MMIFIGIDRRDKIRNNYIRGAGQAEQFEDKVREARLRRFGHVQRRNIE